MQEFAEVWKVYDPSATGMLDDDEDSESRKDKGLTADQKIQKLLADLPLSIGFNELADEEPIKLTEMRLVELPDGSMSRFLSEVQPQGNGMDANVEPKTVYYFHEILYSLLDRKCGRPMPEGNRMVESARREVGGRMPSIAGQVKAMRQQTTASNGDELKISDLVHAYERRAGRSPVKTDFDNDDEPAIGATVEDFEQL